FIRGGVLIAIGGVIATIGFVLVNVAVALGVATLFAASNFTPAAQYALGFVITGAFYLLVGGIIVLAMKARLARQSVVPPRTVEELRKDTQWLKKEL
ncbi:MAG: phage holin family protein, partial [Acidobacteriota bacterium]|nr:phage holin family protein [Acidobacteriota bacterium]